MKLYERGKEKKRMEGKERKGKERIGKDWKGLERVADADADADADDIFVNCEGGERGSEGRVIGIR
jgi:hypothetical protein